LTLFDIEVTPDLSSYDHIIVAFSGGKDSLACLLHLLDTGAPKEKIELWHHDVDGGDPFMDWPCTPAYCRRIAKHLGLDIRFSYREGGFRREMLRENTPTAPTWFERGNGEMKRIGGIGNPNTRRMFPQVSANLSVRWCSAYLKIMVADTALKNDPRFRNKRTLLLTGERAEESASRANYRRFEPHRADLRKGKSFSRHIDHWRPVHAWPEALVWEIIQEHKIVPHPAYYLGWGRLSCMSCIFGNANQWASVREIAPQRFEEIARYEEEFGKTIHRTKSIRQLADEGTPYKKAADLFWVSAAMSETYQLGVSVLDHDDWTLPSGAYGDNTGPT
jgi:3'-phosphoadenosine 5'-phosphosulfate sulfotransferase (PAPS reductase)/FAD synthetase